MAATATNGITQPRGKQEGGESYFFQVVARLEVAENVADDCISFCQVFQSTPSPNAEFSIAEMGWAGERERERERDFGSGLVGFGGQTATKSPYETIGVAERRKRGERNCRGREKALGGREREREIQGVNRAAGAVWRKYGEWRERKSFGHLFIGASGLGFRREYAEFILYPNS
ncbi:unnamed protein product [Prunus armeniaca]